MIENFDHPPANCWWFRVDDHHQQPRPDLASRQVFRAKDSVTLHEDAPPWVTESKLLDNSFFKSDCQAVSEFELRTGAQVIVSI